MAEFVLYAAHEERRQLLDTAEAIVAAHVDVKVVVPDVLTPGFVLKAEQSAMDALQKELPAWKTEYKGAGMHILYYDGPILTPTFNQAADILKARKDVTIKDEMPEAFTGSGAFLVETTEEGIKNVKRSLPFWHSMHN